MQNGKVKPQSTSHIVILTSQPPSYILERSNIVQHKAYSEPSDVKWFSRGRFFYASFNSYVNYFSKPLGGPCGTSSKNVCILHTKTPFGTCKKTGFPFNLEIRKIWNWTEIWKTEFHVITFFLCFTSCEVFATGHLSVSLLFYYYLLPLLFFFKVFDFN